MTCFPPSTHTPPPPPPPPPPCSTTPDDIPIAEAYLAFLAADGDLAAYWRVLSEAGISRARLAGFDRAIVTDPVFWPEKKHALIRDFSAYLKILKEVCGWVRVGGGPHSCVLFGWERDEAFREAYARHACVWLHGK